MVHMNHRSLTRRFALAARPQRPMRAALLVSVLLAAAVVAGQEATPAPAGTEQVDSGTVVNYEQGRNVVIQRPLGTQQVYPVASNIIWPPDLRMNGWVNVYFVPLQGGAIHVTRLTTVPPVPTAAPPTPTSPPPLLLPPEPAATPTPKAARTLPKGAPVRLSMENSATVVAIEPGRSITVQGTDGSKRTYRLDASSQLPARLALQQKVIVETKTENGAQVVRRVLYPAIVISNVPKK